jgi:hypothetical protein
MSLALTSEVHVPESIGHVRDIVNGQAYVG